MIVSLFEIIYTICHNETVHLGALGTHWVEHFFGSMRRLCAGDSTHSNFLRNVTRWYLDHSIRMKLGIQSVSKSRESDSGVILTENDQLALNIEIGFYFTMAHRLLSSVATVKITPLIESILKYQDGIDDDFSIASFMEFLNIPESTIPSSVSTLKQKITSYGGKSSIKFYVCDNQLA